jgi:hypothetical protein
MKGRKAMLINPTKVKLGKRAPRLDDRTLKLSNYFLPSLPLPPLSVDYTGGVTSFGMMLNDNLGNCTIAAVGHAEQIWSIAADGPNSELTVPDALILEKYQQWCGYNPADPSTDLGGVEIDVLNSWRSRGFHPSSHPHHHPLIAYADPDPMNLVHVRQAIQLFGGVYIGLQLPISAQSQDIWAPAAGPNGEPGSWGGHAVFVPAYDAETFTCITWGGLQKMTVSFWDECVDEVHALIEAEFLKGATGETPAGFDLEILLKDVAQVAS